MKLARPELFVDCWERQRILPKCQEVLPQFFVDVDALTDEELGTLEVVAISYCWIDKKHPCGTFVFLMRWRPTIKKRDRAPPLLRVKHLRDEEELTREGLPTRPVYKMNEIDEEYLAVTFTSNED